MNKVKVFATIVTLFSVCLIFNLMTTRNSSKTNYSKNESEVNISHVRNLLTSETEVLEQEKYSFHPKCSCFRYQKYN